MLSKSTVIRIIFLIVILTSASQVFADGTVTTPAGGGGAISADTTNSVTYTTLTAAVVIETNNSGLLPGTYRITAPPGFRFATSTNVNISIGIASGSSKASQQIGLGSGRGVPVSVTPTASTITFNVVDQSTGNTQNSLTFSNIRVQPTVSGCPLVAGNMTIASVNTTSAFANNNMGTLTEVAGAAARMYTVLPVQTYNTNSCAVTGTASDQGVAVPFDLVQLVVTDQFGNLKTTYNNSGVIITYTYTGPGTPVFTTIVNFSGGLSTTPLTTTLTAAATGATITATTGLLTGVPSSAFNVIAGLLPVDHYEITFPNGASGTACLLPVVQITAHAIDNSPVDVPVGTLLNLSTTTGLGTWAATLVSGTQANWSPSGNDDGLASYTWPGGQSSFQIKLSHTTATVNINLQDINLKQDKRDENDPEDGNLVFSADPVIRITTDGTDAASIPTHIAGKDSNIAPLQSPLFIQLKQSGVTTGNRDGCETPDEYSSSPSATSVSVAVECVEPSNCSGLRQITVNGTPVALNNHYPYGDAALLPFTTGNGTPIDFVFDVTDPGNNATDDNKAPLVINYPDAGKIHLHFAVTIDPAGGNNPSRTFVGSSNDFVVRPFGFDIQVTDNLAAPNPAATSAADPNVFTAAGEDFTVTTRAVAWNAVGDAISDGIPDGHDDTDPTNNVDLSNTTTYPSTPNFGQESTNEDVELSALLDQPSIGSGGIDPGLSGGTTITTFTSGSGSSATVKYDEVGIIEITADMASDEGYLAAGAVDGAVISKSGYVGRFVPYVFEAIPNTPVFDPGCGAFSYIGQPFTYATDPVINLTAKAKGVAPAFGTTTQNYTGAFLKLTDAKLLASGNKTYTAASGTLDTINVAMLATDPIIADTGNGTATITFSDGGGIAFDRGDPEDPFDADISLSIEVFDEDDVFAGSADGTTLNPLAFSSIVFDDLDGATTNDDEQRWGRLILDNGFGSELLPIEIPAATEYQDSGDFIRNVEDNCTNYTSLNIAYSNRTGLTVDPSVSGVGTLINGASDPANPLVLVNTLNEVGAIDSTHSTEFWLKYDWDGIDNVPADLDLYDDDPTSRATWGIFAGPKQYIYIREPW